MTFNDIIYIIVICQVHKLHIPLKKKIVDNSGSCLVKSSPPIVYIRCSLQE